MSDSEKNIRKIDVTAFERKIRAHGLWNKEGVIQVFREILAKTEEDKEKKNV